MTRPRFLNDQRGSAATEMALILPLLLVLLFGGFEGGHFLWTQHKLVEGVRDGVRFASRQEVLQVCDGATPIISAGKVAQIKLLTRTGQIDNASAVARVPGWTDAQVNVVISCQAFVDTGIYNNLGGAGPVVTVTANGVRYPSLFRQLGLIDPTILMRARSSAAVVGI
jgi:Flp pilus assembly protein TadG